MLANPTHCGSILRLSGRRTVVTGARGGLGTALVDRLRALGADVTPVSRETAWDPTDFDVLFLNAGFGLLQSSADPVRDDAAEMFHVNLLETIRHAQRALAAGAFHVHVVGSIVSLVSAPHMALYAAAKYGLRGWAYGSARELPGRVSISYPSGIRTGYFANLRGDPRLLDRYRGQVDEAEAAYDEPGAVADGIIEGIAWGAREIIPTPFALEWFTRNDEDTRRMWQPGLRQPSGERFAWWDQIEAHGRANP